MSARLAEPTLGQVLQHLARFYGDRAIVEDLPEALAVLDSADDRRVVEAYAKARRQAPGFAPGSWTKSNHANITDGWRPAVTAEVRRCPGCGASLADRHPSALHCGRRCARRSQEI